MSMSTYRTFALAVLIGVSALFVYDSLNAGLPHYLIVQVFAMCVIWALAGATFIRIVPSR